jgi:tetratricopeptide (TPR) repeat protein
MRVGFHVPVSPHLCLGTLFVTEGELGPRPRGTGRLFPVFLVSLSVVLSPVIGCGGSKPQPAATAKKSDAPDRADLAPPAIKALVEGAAFAKIYLKEGDGTGSKAKAIAKLKEALALDSRLWEAQFNLGLVYARAGELGLSEDALEKAATSAPDAEPVAIALSEVRRRRGDSKAAADGLESFCKAHPALLDARARLVMALREAGRNEEAILHARFVLARRSGDDATRTELALSHLAKGERDVAELLVSQALKQNPKSAPAHRAQGLIALQKGDDADAFRSFEKAAELDPADTTARVNMGNVLLRAGAFKEAEAAFRPVLGTSPGDEGAMLGIAVSLRGQKRFDDARVAYEKLLDRSPRHLAATFGLAILYADHLKNSEKARGLFKQVIDDAPKGSGIRTDAEKYIKDLGEGASKPPVEPPKPPPKKGK